MLMQNKSVRMLICNQCDKKCEDDASLTNHIILCGDVVNNPSCKPCNRTFTETAALEVHMGLHSDVDSKYISSIDKHLHDDKISDILCFQCDQTFTDNDTLEIHMALHSDVSNVLSCNQCDKIFPDNITLETHMLLHTDLISILSCEPCDRTFTNDAALETHIGSHSEVDSKHISKTDSGVNCEEEVEENSLEKEGEMVEEEKVEEEKEEEEKVDKEKVKEMVEEEDLEEMEEEGSSRFRSLRENIAMRDFEILSLSQLDKEVEQLMFLDKSFKGRENIFTSTPVEEEEGQRLEDMEDILEEDRGAETTLARAPGRGRRGRARRWLGRLGGRLGGRFMEIAAKILAAVV